MIGLTTSYLQVGNYGESYEKHVGPEYTFEIGPRS